MLRTKTLHWSVLPRAQPGHLLFAPPLRLFWLESAGRWPLILCLYECISVALFGWVFFAGVMRLLILLILDFSLAVFTNSVSAGEGAGEIFYRPRSEIAELRFGASTVAIPVSLLREHFIVASTLHTWYFANALEEKKFRAFDGGRTLNVQMAVQRRLWRERAKIDSILDFYCDAIYKNKPCVSKLVGKLRGLAKKIDESVGTQAYIEEINSAITGLFDDFLNRKKVSSGAVGTIGFSILQSYFRPPPEFQFAKIPGRDFQIQVTEMSQRDWFLVMGTNPSFFSDLANCPSEHLRFSGVEVCPTLPVENFRMAELDAFLKKLNYFAHAEYRLPLGNEWELASRAGTKGRFFFGEDARDADKFSWLHQNSGMRSHAVATKRSNAWGIYDMHGNLWEIVRSDSDLKMKSRSEPSVETRGGGWLDDPEALSNSFVGHIFSSWTCYDVGFRLAR